MAGILTAWELNPPIPALFAATTGCLLLSFSAHQYKRSVLFVFCLSLAVAGTGCLRTQLLRTAGGNTVADVPEEAVVKLTGHVEKISTREEEITPNHQVHWSRSTLVAHRITANGNSHKTSGRVVLYTFDQYPEFEPGEVIRVEGRFGHRQKTVTNPGGSSWEWYRTERGIGGMMTVDGSHDWESLSPEQSCLRGTWTHWRYTLLDTLQAEGHEFRILPALLFGMREKVPERTEDAFKKSGTLHFLAVSGLHVFFLTLIVYFLLRLTHVPPSMARCLLGGFLLLFLFLSGLRTSAVRATVMGGIFLLAIQIERQIHGVQLLGVAAWVILLLWPLNLYSPGFQFSFLAVLGLLVVFPRLPDYSPPDDDARSRILREFLLIEKCKHLLKKGFSWFSSIFIATVTVLLVTGPVAVQHFHLISVGSLFVNPIFFLLVPILLVLGPVGLLFGVMNNLGVPMAGTLLTACASLIRGVEYLLEELAYGFSGVEPFYVHLPEPGWLAITVYWFCLALVVYGTSFFQQAGRLRLLVCSILWGLVLVSGYFFGVPSRTRSMTMLDVGHGTSIILSGRNGRTIVYDCGAKGFSDPGRWITAPALWNRGVRTIDLLVLSHPDRDHISGIRSLADRFNIRTIWVSSYFDQYPAGKRLLKNLQERGLSIIRVGAGYRKQLGDWDINVLSPPGNPSSYREHRAKPTSNGSSLVLECTSGTASILLTGDLEGRYKTTFKKNVQQQTVDVLQIPHHGGPGSMDNPLSDVIHPEFAFVSAGRDRIDPAVFGTYGGIGATVLDTIRFGALKIRWTKDGHITAESFKDGWHRKPASQKTAGQRARKTTNKK